MLRNIRIASPCPAEWEQMAGDGRVRYCPACNLNVYNLAEMTETEVRQLRAHHEGRLCARLYQRKDGTVLTKDCPVGMRAVAKRVSRIAAAVFSAMTLQLSFAAAQTPRSDNSQQLVQISNQETGIDLSVKDSAGTMIQGAKVTLVDQTNKKKIKGKTDDHGRLLLTNLHTGDYKIKVEHKEFVTYTGTVSVEEHATSKLEVRIAWRPVTITVGGLE